MSTSARRTSDSLRTVTVSRTGPGRFRATNARGGGIEFGSGDGDAFTPVELLLAAMAGCSAIDVDIVTRRRSEPTAFDVEATAHKVRDENGNHLVDPHLRFAVTFPDGEAGDAARTVLPDIVRRSHEQLCTVTRTMELATQVDVTIATESAD